MDFGTKELERLQDESDSASPKYEKGSEWAAEGVDYFQVGSWYGECWKAGSTNNSQQEMGDGDVALDLMHRGPGDMLDGNFEEFSDVYNRLALEPNRSRQQK